MTKEQIRSFTTPLRFCWSPSPGSTSLRSAILVELEKLELPAITASHIVGTATSAVRYLLRGDLWPTDLIREIRSPGDQLFEIRLDFGLPAEIGPLRIYCHLVEDRSLVIGLAARFKSLVGGNDSIRSLQNTHIEQARRVLGQALEERLAPCIERKTEVG